MFDKKSFDQRVQCANSVLEPHKYLLEHTVPISYAGNGTVVQCKELLDCFLRMSLVWVRSDETFSLLLPHDRSGLYKAAVRLALYSLKCRFLTKQKMSAQSRLLWRHYSLELMPCAFEALTIILSSVVGQLFSDCQRTCENAKDWMSSTQTKNSKTTRTNNKQHTTRNKEDIQWTKRQSNLVRNRDGHFLATLSALKLLQLEGKTDCPISVEAYDPRQGECGFTNLCGPLSAAEPAFTFNLGRRCNSFSRAIKASAYHPCARVMLFVTGNWNWNMHLSMCNFAPIHTSTQATIPACKWDMNLMKNLNYPTLDCKSF